MPTALRSLLFLLVPCLVSGASIFVAGAAADDPAPAAPSALEADPAGWLDLMPAADLHGWKRFDYPGKPLKEPNIWSVDADGKILRCEGTGTHENLLFDRDFADGIFHVEWRFKKIEGGTGYNSGVFVRTSPDGAVWHQAQVGNLNVGYIFGSTLRDGKPERFKIDDRVPQRGKDAGEWNTYEVTCKGKAMSLWINGAVTATWIDCPVMHGLVGLEAEGWLIEFRNLKYKEFAP